MESARALAPPSRGPSLVAWGAAACLVQLVVPLLGAPFGAVIGVVTVLRASIELRAIERGTIDEGGRTLVRVGRLLAGIGGMVGIVQVLAFFVGLLFFSGQVLHLLGWLFAWIPAGFAPPIP